MALQIIEILLGLAFTVAGTTKLFMTAKMLAIAVPPWITSFPPNAVRVFGAAELAGGVAVLVASVTGNTPWGASILTIVMILAVITHLVRGDLRNIMANAVLLLLSAFVMWRG